MNIRDGADDEKECDKEHKNRNELKTANVCGACEATCMYLCLKIICPASLPPLKMTLLNQAQAGLKIYEEDVDICTYTSINISHSDRPQEEELKERLRNAFRTSFFSIFNLNALLK